MTWFLSTNTTLLRGVKLSKHSRQLYSSISPTHSIYVSKSTNPYFNLSFEDWLFRHKPPQEPLLMMYRDEPCVVIGRNQNPWKEVNMVASKRTGIPFIRRRSGGGTVYHDLGNTNFSIHVSRTQFDRRVTAQVVLRAVRALGIDANLNDRNDICVGNEKISSAYKIVNKRAYHHGTMLISTRLDTLGDLLRTNKETMITKGVASVRSPVCNLQQFQKAIAHEVFVQAVIEEFRKEYDINQEARIIDEDESTKDIEYIRNGMAELSRWDWAFGQTPEFEYTISKQFCWGLVEAKIVSKHGVILSCALWSNASSVTEKELRSVSKVLEGQRYGLLELPCFDGRSTEILNWLKESTEI